MTVNEIDNEINKLKEDLKNIKGTECEVYTRIVGYHRNITNWNKGKKEEYKKRKEFKLDKLREINNKNNIEYIEKEDKLKEIININTYKLFTSPICVKCPPVKEYIKNISIKGIEYDVTNEDGLNEAQKYNIMSTPSIVLFDNNDNIIKVVNSLSEIKKILK